MHMQACAQGCIAIHAYIAVIIKLCILCMIKMGNIYLDLWIVICNSYKVYSCTHENGFKRLEQQLDLLGVQNNEKDPLAAML